MGFKGQLSIIICVWMALGVGQESLERDYLTVSCNGEFNCLIPSPQRWTFSGLAKYNITAPYHLLWTKRLLSYQVPREGDFYFFFPSLKKIGFAFFKQSVQIAFVFLDLLHTITNLSDLTWG